MSLKKPRKELRKRYKAETTKARWESFKKQAVLVLDDNATPFAAFRFRIDRKTNTITPALPDRGETRA